MTPHVLDQLPLWVEDDLSAPEQAAIEAHLAQCPECRAASEHLRASQAWLREALASPFGPQDQEGLRHKVMAQLQAEYEAEPGAKPGPEPRLKGIRRLASRPALLAASAAALLIAAFGWRVGQAPASLPAPSQPLPSQTVGTVHLPAPSLQAPGPAGPQSSQARAAPAAGSAPKPISPGPPRGEPVRIEIQTADPTVRIIWLAQAGAVPQSTDPQTEEP